MRKFRSINYCYLGVIEAMGMQESAMERTQSEKTIELKIVLWDSKVERRKRRKKVS